MAAVGKPILVGVGGNLFFSRKKAPLSTCQSALETLKARGIGIVKQSCWYLSSPVPDDDQPWYINCVICVCSDLEPNDLLAELLTIEREFGRPIHSRSGARTLDLDLLAHGEMICQDQGRPPLTLPHPRMAQRAFVTFPLSDIMPEWLHPVLGLRARELACMDHDGQKLVCLSPEALEI